MKWHRFLACFPAWGLAACTTTGDELHAPPGGTQAAETRQVRTHILDRETLTFAKIPVKAKAPDGDFYLVQTVRYPDGHQVHSLAALWLASLADPPAAIEVLVLEDVVPPPQFRSVQQGSQVGEPRATPEGTKQVEAEDPARSLQVFRVRVRMTSSFLSAELSKLREPRGSLWPRQWSSYCQKEEFPGLARVLENQKDATLSPPADSMAEESQFFANGLVVCLRFENTTHSP